MHAYHAYSARMHTYNTYARKNQRRSSKIKPRPQKPRLRRGWGALRAPHLWSGLDFVRVSQVFACAGACMCIVCMHACGVCMICMTCKVVQNCFLQLYVCLQSRVYARCACIRDMHAHVTGAHIKIVKKSLEIIKNL